MDTVAPPLRLLFVGSRADELAHAAVGHIASASCHRATNLAAALDVLAAHPIDAVICALDAAEGRRLFQIMHTCYGEVWRVLFTDGAHKPTEAVAVASLADACVAGDGDPATPWHLVSAMRLAPPRR
jgi:hypothetical protein